MVKLIPQFYFKASSAKVAVSARKADTAVADIRQDIDTIFRAFSASRCFTSFGTIFHSNPGYDIAGMAQDGAFILECI